MPASRQGKLVCEAVEVSRYRKSFQYYRATGTENDLSPAVLVSNGFHIKDQQVIAGADRHRQEKRRILDGLL